MKKRSSMADLPREGQSDQSPLKKHSLDVTAMEISPTKIDPEEIRAEQFPPHLIRLSEIFLTAVELFQYMDTSHFDTFRDWYSHDAEEGFELFELFAERFEELDDSQLTVGHFCKQLQEIFNPEDYDHLRSIGKLSIYNQLLQIIARWNVHNWIIDNTQRIHMLHAQGTYCPNMLALLGITKTDNEVILPKIEIHWLISLVQPLLSQDNPEPRVAAVLSQRKHHAELLQFSAQRPYIDFLLSQVDTETLKIAPKLLSFILDNSAFFRAVLTQNLPKNVDDYASASSHTSTLFENLVIYREQLLELLLTERFTNNPLFYILCDAYLAGRLQMLLYLAQVDAEAPDYKKALLKTVTWMEKHREVLALTLKPNNPWQNWLEQTKAYKPIVQNFAQGLFNALNNDQAIDIRGFKTGSMGEITELKPFASAQHCFEDVISGLEQRDRDSKISCTERDVLLYRFLRYNPAVLAHFADHLDNMTAVIAQFQEHKVRKQTQGVAMPLSPQKTNTSIETDFSPKRVRATPVARPLDVPDENDEAARARFTMK